MATFQRHTHIAFLTSRLVVAQVRQYSEKSFFQTLMDSRIVNPETHSKGLTADNKTVYKFQFDHVKPVSLLDYLNNNSAVNAKLHEDVDYPGQLFGSWTTLYGCVQQAVHIWVYKDGYKGIDEHTRYCKENKELQEVKRLRRQWCYSRKSAICQQLSYWGVGEEEKQQLYELRTYSLKPGTLIEWSNKWGTTMNVKRREAIGAFYSEIGDLYTVHHLWSYQNIEHRAEVRNSMWQIPGWDDCVAQTVPLVESMRNNIMVPISTDTLQ